MRPLAELRKRGFKAFRLEDGYPSGERPGYQLENGVGGLADGA